MILQIALVGMAFWVLREHTPNPLQEWCDHLLDAALRKHPHDPRFQKARAAINAVMIDSPDDMVNYDRKTVRRGRFDRQQGMLYIGVVRHTGKPLPDDLIKGILVHEAAHAALDTGKHSSEWQDVYLALLRVATQDLGWKILLECSSCKFYGVCSPTQCPLCAWKACKGLKDSLAN